MNKPMIDLQGQVCLVTGAGSPTGIGFATARLLGEAGAVVAICATTDRIHERAKELEKAGIRARGFIADLMERSQVQKMVQQVLDEFQKIDILVNNAGMVQVGMEEDFSGFLEMTDESWDDSIDRNLNIPYNVTRAVLPQMVEQQYGRIVNVSSVTGPVVSNPGESAYSAAKAAVIGMSRSLAIEFGGQGITVNCVLPGWIGTASQTEAEQAGGENTPLGRSASGEEVASAIVFLASPVASYITGESIIVDGGNTIQEYKGPKELYY